MIRYLFFIFLLAIIIYFLISWTIKWIDSTRVAVERKEFESWKKYDNKINPKVNKKK